MRSEAEKISFTIWNYGDFCRIEANDCRTTIRNLSDGACIFDLDILLHELDRIGAELEKINAIPVFTTAPRIKSEGGQYV